MRDFAAYAATLALIRCLRCLPLRAALALGRGLGALAFHVLRIRRRVVFGNLRYVFGETRTEREIHALARDAYRQFAMNVIEILRSAITPPERFEGAVEIDGVDGLKELQAAGEPVIVCAPHAGNFDLLGYAAARQGVRLSVMMRPVKSKRFHELLVEGRERYGIHLLMKGEEAFHEMFDLLEEGKTVALLPDQNARSHGVTIDFLGRPASTFQGPAVLHLVTGAALMVVVIGRRRDDVCRHDARIRRLDAHPPTGDRKRDIREVTQKICDVMAEEILREPGQYFWFHRRWGKEIFGPETARGAKPIHEIQ